ncbi:MAG: hypothetical protein ACXQTS_05980 [Candidatus Methanospirareceae archaeon]
MMPMKKAVVSVFLAAVLGAAAFIAIVQAGILPGAIKSEHLSDPIKSALCNYKTGAFVLAPGAYGQIVARDKPVWGFLIASSNITGSIEVGSWDGHSNVTVITNEGLATKMVADDCGGLGLYIKNINATETMLVNYTFVYHTVLS